MRSEKCELSQFLNSGRYDSNFDTSNLEDSYPSGKQVRVGCNVGYTGFFKMICSTGGWSYHGSKCVARSCGHPGDAQFADFELEKGEDFVFGSQVVYTCHRGYQMVSRTNYRRCLAGGWDGVVPVCEAQQCPVIHVDNSVQVIGDPEEANYGNVVRFRCKSSKQILKGLTDIYCDENGQWSGAAPICEEITCDIPVIENGFVSGEIRKYKEEEVLEFVCNHQYKRSEERLSKCTKLGNTANWSPTPGCKEIKCELTLPAIEGTRYDPDFRSLFSPGDTVRVICGENYWISTSQDTSAVSTCQDNGEWTIRPICHEVTCRNQRHRDVSYWNVYWGQRITLGVTASYTCRSGYKKTGDRLTCTRDGWSPDPPCQEVKCDRKILPFADIVEDYRQEYKINEQARYVCKDQYKRPFTITCKEEGWDVHHNCEDTTCPEVQIQNGFSIVLNETLYYACNDGFKLFTKGWWGEAKCKKRNWSTIQRCIEKNRCGEVPKIPNGKEGNHETNVNQPQTISIVCNEGYQAEIDYLICEEGEWHSNGTPFKKICKPRFKPCKAPPIVENAVVKGPYNKEYLSDSTVTYRCRQKYTMEGHPTITCRNGKWNKVDINCASYCHKPTNEQDTMKVIEDKERYMHEDVIKYECLTSGAKTGNATCVHGEWDKPVTCKALSCDPPPAGGTIKVVGLPRNGEPILPDRFLEFSCDDPGKRLTGSSRLTCGKDGQWDEPFPSCEDITCKVDVMQPHLQVDGQLANKTAKIGETLHFFCDDGFNRDGSDHVVCLETGEWNAPFPTCSETCTVTGLPRSVRIDEYLEGQQLRKGQKLKFYCRLRGDTLQGKREVECIENGEWSGPFPTCGDPLGCGKPPLLADGDIQTTTKFHYEHNERVEYLCQRYYVMEGGPYRTCNNGEWTGEMRCIKPCTVDKELLREHHLEFRHISGDKLYSAHDDVIEFRCASGRRHAYRVNMRRKCFDGVMHLPTCY